MMLFTFDSYCIRKLTVGDEVGFFKLIENNRQRLEAFFAGTIAKNKNINESKLFVESCERRIKEKKYFPFVVVDNLSNELVEFIDIKNIDWSIPKAEIGYFIDKNYEGKHITTRAVACVVKYCFAELGLVKLFLRTHESNQASLKIAVNNFFKVEGKIRKDYKTTEGDIVDLIYFGLVKEDIRYW